MKQCTVLLLILSFSMFGNLNCGELYNYEEKVMPYLANSSKKWALLNKRNMEKHKDYRKVINKGGLNLNIVNGVKNTEFDSFIKSIFTFEYDLPELQGISEEILTNFNENTDQNTWVDYNLLFTTKNLTHICFVTINYMGENKYYIIITKYSGDFNLPSGYFYLGREKSVLPNQENSYTILKSIKPKNSKNSEDIEPIVGYIRGVIIKNVANSLN